ncbi:MAG: putative sulfate exporter family transporter [Pseudomonadota bacterium]
MVVATTAKRETAFTVVAVTSLSTIAMVLYPLIARLVGFADTDAGIFIGGSIHDVAQVVGAGYTISEEAGQSATLTKLFRVALLAPIVIAVAMMFRERQQQGGLKGLAPPPMLVGFIILAGLNSVGLLPPPVVHMATVASTACLVTAVAAIGARTEIAELRSLGWKPLALVIAETMFLAVILVIGIKVVL